MLMIHGTEDSFSPYDGGASSVPSSTGIVTGIDSTIYFWANHNSYLNILAPDSIVVPDINTEDNSHVVSYDFTPCNSNGDVLLYKVYGGGHNVPGGPGPVFVPIIGYSNKDINGAYEIWQFFSNKSCDTLSSIDEFDIENTISVYPNPSQNRVYVKSDLEVQVISVYNLSGKKVAFSNSSSIDMEQLPSGLYLLDILFLGEGLSTKRLIQKM